MASKSLRLPPAQCQTVAMLSYHNPEGSVSLVTPSAPSADPVLVFVPATDNTAPRQEMVLCNNDLHLWLAYKVQSNAQKKYAVTPTSGLLPPGGDRKVQITVALKQGKGHTTQGDKMLVRCVGVEMNGDAAGDEETTLSYDPALWKKAPKQTMLKLFVPCVVGHEHKGGEGAEQERKKAKKPPPPPQDKPVPPQSSPPRASSLLPDEERDGGGGGSSTIQERVEKENRPRGNQQHWLAHEASTTTKAKLLSSDDADDQKNQHQKRNPGKKKTTFHVGLRRMEGGRPMLPSWNGLGPHTTSAAQRAFTLDGGVSKNTFHPALVPHLKETSELSHAMKLLVQDGSRAKEDVLTKEEMHYLSELHEQTSGETWEEMRGTAKKIRTSLIAHLKQLHLDETAAAVEYFHMQEGKEGRGGEEGKGGREGIEGEEEHGTYPGASNNNHNDHNENNDHNDHEEEKEDNTNPLTIILDGIHQRSDTGGGVGQGYSSLPKETNR